MNYLFLYLRTISDDESRQILGVDLAPRERQALDLLLALRSAPATTKEEAIEQLAMSNAMFDKTCSVVLRRVWEKLVPEGGLAMLEDLNLRGLRPLFLHEMRRQEKEERDAGGGKRLAEFYGGLFDILHHRFSSDYDEKLARRVARKYAALGSSPDTAIYCNACILGAEIWKSAAQGTGDEHSSGLRRKLESNDRRIRPETGARARYQQLNAWIIYYGQVEFDSARRRDLLGQSLALCRDYPDQFPSREEVIIRCKIAEEHYFYQTDLETPWRMYRDLFDQHGDLLADNFYHATKFIQLSLVLGEFKRAEELLRRFFGYDLTLEIGGRSKMGSIHWTKFYLMTGKMEEARRYLDLAFEQNQKKFYVQYEIECRLLQTAWCFLNGDFETVEQMAPANIKYLRSKNYTFANSRFYPWFFKLAIAFIDERKLGTPLPAKLEAKFEEFMEGAAAQYGMLLRGMRGRKWEGSKK